MFALTDVDGIDYATFAMLNRLTVASDRNGARSVDAGIERSEGGPSEQHDKKEKASRRAMQQSCCLTSKREKMDESWIAGLIECG